MFHSFFSRCFCCPYFLMIHLLSGKFTTVHFRRGTSSFTKIHKLFTLPSRYNGYFYFTGDSILQFSPQIVPSLSGSSLKSFQNLLPLSLPCVPTRNVKKNKERVHSIFAALHYHPLAHKKLFSPVLQVDKNNIAI